MTDLDLEEQMNLRKTFKEAAEYLPPEELKSNAVDELEKLCVIVAGNTGAGKSTLINALLGREVTKEGEGRPVTAEIKAIPDNRDRIVVIDTPGFEAGANVIFANLERFIDMYGDSIGIAYLVISPSRFTEIHDDFLRIVDAHRIPTVVCLTKIDHDSADDVKFISTVEKEAAAFEKKSRNKTSIKVLDVRAKDIKNASGVVKKKSYGMLKLFDLSLEVINPRLQSTFIFFQDVNLEAKEPLVTKSIWRHTALAISAVGAIAGGGVMGVPLPAAGPIAVVGIIYKMFSEINDIYNSSNDNGGMITKLSGTTIAACIVQVIPAAAATIGAGELVNIIPIGGPLVNSIVQLTSLPPIVYVMGKLYNEALFNLKRSGVSSITEKDIEKALKEESASKAKTFANEFKRVKDQIAPASAKGLFGWVKKLIKKD